MVYINPQKEDNPNHFKSVTIGLMSPEDILRRSYGETLKPETINYRSYKP